MTDLRDAPMSTTTDPREVIAAAIRRMTQAGESNVMCARWIMEDLRKAGLSIVPVGSGEVGNRVQGMVRTMDQWRDFKPEAVAEGSDAQVFYFIRDAKTDMNALWRFAVDTLARAEAAEASLAAVTADRDRLVEALRRCLNFIENTEGEHDVELECGNLARAALTSMKAVAGDPICRQCASGEPGIPEECTCERAALTSTKDRK